MSKRLPYFQFEPAEWLAGDIMFCSFSAQGLFTTIKAIYWQKDCDLSLAQAKKRLKNEELFDELIQEKIIKIIDGKIKINFLDEQFLNANKSSETNSKNGKKGAEKRWGKHKENSEIIATPSNGHSETIALREDEIKEEDIKEKKDVVDESTNFDNSKNLMYSNLLKSEAIQWQETVAMQFKIPPNSIPKKLEEFTTFLSTTFKAHPNKKEFISHFINWLPKNLQNEHQSNNNSSGGKKQFKFSTIEAVQTITGSPK